MLFNQFNEKSTGAQFGNIRSVKEVRSIANQARAAARPERNFTAAADGT